jgi:hypothetical protein
MTAHMNSDVPAPAPKLSDKPVRWTALAFLGLFVVAATATVVGMPYISLGHRLYIAVLVAGLGSVGGLLLTVVSLQVVAAFKALKPAVRVERKEAPAGVEPAMAA